MSKANGMTTYEEIQNELKTGVPRYELAPGETYNQSYLDYIKNPNILKKGVEGDVLYEPWSGPLTTLPPGSSDDGGGTGGGGGGPAVGGLANLSALSRVPEYQVPNIGNAPDYIPPSLREMPGYNAPRWDENEIDALTQKRAAPGLRALRNEVQRVTARSYGSPQVTKMTLRDALQGYGSGVDRTLSGASQVARGEYGQKYGTQVDAAKTGLMAESARTAAANDAAREAARIGYTGKMSEWEAKSQLAADAAKTNFGAQASAASDFRRFGLEESALNAAYERWKNQQTWTRETQNNWAREDTVNPPAQPTVPRFEWKPLARG